ncbi:hypothetical protein [uncultured Endozoicomonas sp.]|uniref:hypothetical protein n=1 Tax=uncultured Endozoicomonas sp. TaxID=432652 RepID=UPI0026367DD8|nr:hypothetical protein [uncultured Endozoicomonas sp.]
MSKGYGKLQLAIIDYLKHSESAAMEVYFISEDLDSTKQAVGRALKRLLADGLVIKEQRRVNISGKNRIVNTYILPDRIETSYLEDHEEAIETNKAVDIHGCYYKAIAKNIINHFKL